MTPQRIAIIDIGSNSIRLVIYERTGAGAHHVIEGAKRAARLSAHIGPDGELQQEALDRLLDLLRHYQLICSNHRTYEIRAIATAAIRNASNCKAILETVRTQTGIVIELLSGEEEARYGFLGMVNTLDVADGFLVDIGGGSTELSLFRNRQLLHSHSFPFGCVNLTHRMSSKGVLDDEQLAKLYAHVAEALDTLPWVNGNEGLPLVCVGGTARALGKIQQAREQYPLGINHNYPISTEAAETVLQGLRLLPLDKRRKYPGLSKDRLDVIVPGLAVLQQIQRSCGATHYLICGAGLRDGLFYAIRFPKRPVLEDMLAYSVDNLLALHPVVPLAHVRLVRAHACTLFDTLADRFALTARDRTLLATAAVLHRIGTTIDYYQYEKHTFYLIVHSGLNGLTHRELVLLAAVASYRTKNKARQQLGSLMELLNQADLLLMQRLGTLLQLAIALDSSETQALSRFKAVAAETQLALKPLAAGTHALEAEEIRLLADDFSKAWGLVPELL